MRKSLKKVRFLMVVSVTILLLAIAAYSAPVKLGPATFTYYTFNTDDNSKACNNYVMKELKTLFPEVTINIEAIDTTDRTYTKMKTYIASNDVPEFFTVFQIFTDALISTGQIADLGPYADKTGFNAQATPIAKELGMYKGKLYCMPGQAISVGMWYYNKALFTKYNVKIPKTYAELLKAVAAFKANNIIPISIGGKEKWFYAMFLDEFATRYSPTAGTDVVAGKAKFTDEPYMKAAAKIQELAKAGAFSKDVNLKDYGAAEADFTSGKAAMIINGSWAFAAYDNLLKDNFGYLYFPVDDPAKFEAGKVHWAGGDVGPTGIGFNPKKFKTRAELDRAAKIAFGIAKGVSDYYGSIGNPITCIKTKKGPAGGFSANMRKWMKDFNNIQTSPPYINALMPIKAQPAFLDAVQNLSTGEYDAAKFCADTQKNLDDNK